MNPRDSGIATSPGRRCIPMNGDSGIELGFSRVHSLDLAIISTHILKAYLGDIWLKDMRDGRKKINNKILG